MAPCQQRVITEKSDLDEKIGKLKTFIDSSLFINIDFEEQDRLRRQLVAMEEYSGILSERISAFKQVECLEG